MVDKKIYILQSRRCTLSLSFFLSLFLSLSIPFSLLLSHRVREDKPAWRVRTRKNTTYTHINSHFLKPIALRCVTDPRAGLPVRIEVPTRATAQNTTLARKMPVSCICSTSMRQVTAGFKWETERERERERERETKKSKYTRHKPWHL